MVEPLYLKRLLILVGLIELLLELESSHLFLWPLDHSCAKSDNLTKVVYLLEKPIRGDDIQANLFSATPEDSFTVARASSLGIHYDDIASCYEYPVEYSSGGDSEADMEKLETCKHGLYFEKAEDTLSVVAQFHLACSRQQLKVLLLQCIGLGLWLGLVFTCWQEKFHHNRQQQQQPRINSSPYFSEIIGFGFLSWTLVQIIATLINLFCTDHLTRLRHLPSLLMENKQATDDQVHQNDSYIILLACAFFRSFITASCLVKILSIQRGLLNRNFYTQLREKQLYFHTLAVVYTIFRALYYPLALRIISTWTSLNAWLTITNLTFLVATIGYQCSPTMLKAVMNVMRSKGGRNSRGILTSGQSASEMGVNYQLTSTGGAEADNDFVAEELEVGDKRGRIMSGSDTKAALTSPSMMKLDGSVSCEPNIRVCEFCLVKQAKQQYSVYAVESGFMNPQQYENNNNNNNNIDNTQANGIHCSGVCNSSSQNGDDSSTQHHSSIDYSQATYRPTTMPIGPPAALVSGLPTGGSHPKLGGQEDRFYRGQQTHHNYSQAFGNLIARPVISQLWLLAFCVTFNYFLFCMLPDHELLHSESISSRQERKQLQLQQQQQQQQQQRQLAHLSEQQSAIGQLPAIILKEEFVPNGAAQAPEKEKYMNVTYHLDANNGAVNQTHQPTTPSARISANATSFNLTLNAKKISQLIGQTITDFRSINYSTKSIGILNGSNNPLLILWTTIYINGWPIELVVIILHLSYWFSSFQETFFKLNRLLVLVIIGARLLIVQWILIAILRGQNHLFEWDWLHTIALILARFSATLMLYNYFYTMLKISLKLGVDSLVKLAPICSCVFVAFIMGSMGPIMEKLNLIIIPIALIINNSLAYLVAKNLNKSFKLHLCPVMFGEA